MAVNEKIPYFAQLEYDSVFQKGNFDSYKSVVDYMIVKYKKEIEEYPDVDKSYIICIERGDYRGAMEYFCTEFIKPKKWKTKKQHKKKVSKCRCGICGSENNIDLHHLTYKNIFNEELSDLRFLCRRCHSITHLLIKEGIIKFENENTNSRFLITKARVKKYLGLGNKNMFYQKK